MDKKNKLIIFGQKVREHIDRGLYITYESVATTLGSKGRNVAYELNWGFPNVIHDGVTVAKQIVLKNPFENMAAQLVIAAAQKTNDEAGDGTTTATILTYAIAHEALKIVAAGTNPAIIRKGIEKAVEQVVTELQDMAKPVSTLTEMQQVATISATDEQMGKLIATAVQKVGKNGVVTVTNGASDKTHVEYKEGMEFDQGFISPWLMNDSNRLEAIYTSKATAGLYVVCYNDKVDNDVLVTLLEKVWSTDPQAKVLVIANDYDVDSVYSIIATKQNGKKGLVAVKAPDYGEHRFNILDDIAILTGGTVIGGAGMQLEQATFDHIGRCDQVVVSKDTTQIIGGKGNSEKIQTRIRLVKKQMKNAGNEFQKDKFETRLAKLVGGVAVINVGGASETEVREKKEKIIDAVNATKAAIEEGIVAGGGVALLRARKAIDSKSMGNEKIGAEILRSALLYPIRRLIANAGVENVDHIIGKIGENKNNSYGYNVDTEEYVDLIKEGIIDPVKVSRSALRNAASIATMLITTQCMIAFEREETKTNNTSDEGIGILPD